MIYRDNLHDIAFDIIRNGRYHHKTTLQFATVRNAQSQTERDLLATEFGIRKKPSIFDKVTRDRYLQCPHDAFHCVGGLAREMLQATFQTFSTIGENAFLEIWHNFEFPPTWSRQQNPITHLGSYFFSDCLCLCMIMPFLIYRAISNTAMLNKAFVEHLIKEFSEIGYNDLQQRIMQWAMQIAKVTQFNFSILSKDQCVRSLLDSWYILPSITNLEQEDEISQITCMHENFINVRVQGKYNKYELQAANLEQSLNDDLLAELIHAYQEELGCTEHLATRKIKYFKSISYTIVDKDDQVDVNLRVGDIVDVLEDISSDGETNLRITTSYAKIQAIFIHKKINN
ncbi:22742_t:CDS:2 [Rhizophagus irregularis]|nr:22742_t:CDS:2 [Rhizophagus irregularis]